MAGEGLSRKYERKKEIMDRSAEDIKKYGKSKYASLFTP
jgi:hypothetical protein